MTQVSYSNRDGLVRISVTGHALYNPGNDIVCASVSTITYQLLNFLHIMEGNGQIRDLVSDITDGWVILTFRVADIGKDTWSIAWRVVKTGYEMLAQNYPDNVRIG